MPLLCHIKILLRYLTLLVGVDHQDFGLLEAKFLRLPEILANCVCEDIFLRHDEENGLRPEFLVRLVVVPPTLNGRLNPVAVLLSHVLLRDPFRFFLRNLRVVRFSDN